MAGVDLVHVPYRGGGPAMQDLIGDRVDYICTLSATAVPQIESKLVKSVAVFSPARVPMLPDMPTAKEQGFSSFEASTWFGLMVPKGTPEPIIKRLHDAWPNAIMIHTPVHASWLNQAEIFFSITQRKVLTSSDFASLEELASMAQIRDVSVTDSAVDKRFTPQCARLLHGVLEELTSVVVQAAQDVPIRLLRRGSRGAAAR